MSQFLGFESFLINLGSTPQGVQDTFKAALTNYGWRIISEATIPVAYLNSTPWNTSQTAKEAADCQPISGFISVISAPTAYVGFQFSGGFAPVAIYITSETLYFRTPSAFTLEYSDNGSTWTVLQTWTGINEWIQAYQRRKFVISDATAHAYWRLNMSAKQPGSDAYFAVSEFVLENATGQYSSSVNYLDVLPPVSEAIGNTTAREALRIEIPSVGTSISFKPTVQLLTNIKQVIAIQPKTAGNVQAGVTINGITILQSAGTMNAGNTAIQNHRYLYEAIKASTDPNFTDFNWEYQNVAAQNANDPNTWILGTKKTDGRVTPVANANVYAYIQGDDVIAPQMQWRGSSPYSGPNGGSVTIDLVNGFIYYLQVCARGIAFATKTNAAYYGPIHACWGDNAKALAAIPSTGWALPVMPIELVVGADNAATSTDSYGYLAHWWGMASTGSGMLQTLTSNNSGHPFSLMSVRHKIMDWMSDNSTYSPLNTVVGLYGSNFFVSGVDGTGNDFQIHRVGMNGEGSFYQSNQSPNSGTLRCVSPILDIQDWYKFVGVAADEALILVADTITTTQLTTDLSAAANTVTVASTTGFATSGYVVIESEIIQYTGVTPTSFTGCTHGKFATVATNHYNGDSVAPGLWFTKINGGALYCGTSKPV